MSVKWNKIQISIRLRRLGPLSICSDCFHSAVTITPDQYRDSGVFVDERKEILHDESCASDGTALDERRTKVRDYVYGFNGANKTNN